ncbi:MAG TPA: response regulator [Roseiflexaceae bacterium]|nr:response regulator [Roseiflexaceae bacterium]
MAYRLLIIPGDNADLRALSGQLAEDVEVQVLDSANDALWEVRNSPPEAIVADVELPGMSGMDLAEILPNFGVPTRVVLWSRSPDHKAAEQAASHGVHTFLNGPLSSDQLHDAVYHALGRGESGEPVAPPPAEPEPPVAPPGPPAEPEPPRRSRPFASQPPAEPERPRRDRAEAPRAQPSSQARQAPAPPPPPEPPARKPAPRPRGGSLVLTEENIRPIRARMESLSQDIGSQCILLANRAGMVLTEVGITSGLPTMILLPLLSTSFSTAGQISQMLREDDSTALYMHEGNRYDLYCFDILQSFMLVIVFDKSGLATAKIGSVWVYAKRAIRDMQELLG